MPIKNEQMFLDAIKELKKKKSPLNRGKLLNMTTNWLEKNPKSKGRLEFEEAYKKYKNAKNIL